METIELAVSKETGKIGIMHLKRYWDKAMARRTGAISQQAYDDEWNLDITLLNALGLGLEQTVKYLFLEKPLFEQFEDWVLHVNGGAVSPEKINDFNRIIVNNTTRSQANVRHVLSEEDIECWNNNGYVIIREAVSKADCNAAIDAICDFLAIDKDDPSTWYNAHPARQGIMVQMFQHPVLEKNRKAPKIRAAYEQLWGRTDLWMNTDRVSFNPPQTESWTFPGPRLHWDVSLELPIPFGLLGLLYLSDTQASQGAFTLVPGFHKKVEAWINSLPPNADPRMQDLYQLGPEPVAANAGDFIIWHQALPHGSSANTSTKPRIVQYINYLPVNGEIKEKWK